MIPEQRRRGRHRPEAIRPHDRQYMQVARPFGPLVVGTGRHRLVSPWLVAALHDVTLPVPVIRRPS